jgi:hypothetical protein
MRAAMNRRTAHVLAPAVACAATTWAACGGAGTLQAPAASGPGAQAGSATEDAGGGARLDAAGASASPGSSLAEAGAGSPEATTTADAAPGPGADPACPADMAHVVHDFCPKVERRCVKKELNKPNHIVLCHKFQPGSTRCLDKRHRLDFCIDRYEHPNRAGAHPPWMVSWHDAEATCRKLGKRTCWDWEWVAACEGPGESPFPYGWERDNTKCNIDNMWIEPHLKDAYSKDPAVALRELSRIDQSVPSGAMPGCVSGFGVHDMTGNMDEWVTRTKRDDKEKSEWAGLKGGAWGHVRNACRPMTTSHPPDFTYYFITFRCCRDPAGAPAYVPPGAKPPPAVEPADRAPIPVPINPPGPSKQKVRPENDGT